MLCDTHCHLSYIHERGENLKDVLTKLGEQDFRFVLDIGTKPGDFNKRVAMAHKASSCFDLSGRLPPFLHFSCGLWPDAEVIDNRDNAIAQLESDIDAMISLARERSPDPSNVFVALGECGLDRYWNGENAPGRLELLRAKAEGGKAVGDDGHGSVDIGGEEDLFCRQIELSKKHSLAVIVHSRLAFEATVSCLKNSACTRGVIHCFSYGKTEARDFLDLGFHISFPGTITWPKKEVDRAHIAALVRYIPHDRLLLETDAPYLAPTPHRGAINTPLLISEVYTRTSEILGIEIKTLASIIESNAKKLFSL